MSTRKEDIINILEAKETFDYLYEDRLKERGKIRPNVDAHTYAICQLFMAVKELRDIGFNNLEIKSKVNEVIIYVNSNPIKT